MIRQISLGAGLATLAACSAVDRTSYLVDAGGDFIGPERVSGDSVTGYFACAGIGPSCAVQAREACARYDMTVDSVQPLDRTIPVSPTGFNYFPIKPNRKVTCVRDAEDTQ